LLYNGKSIFYNTQREELNQLSHQLEELKIQDFVGPEVVSISNIDELLTALGLRNLILETDLSAILDKAKSTKNPYG